MQPQAFSADLPRGDPPDSGKRERFFFAGATVMSGVIFKQG